MRAANQIEIQRRTSPDKFQSYRGSWSDSETREQIAQLSPSAADFFRWFPEDEFMSQRPLTAQRNISYP
jgi:hypothetical protein